VEHLIATLRVVHLVSAVLMAWPTYALVAVNQRARLGPPLGDRVDAYLESVIKNRTIPCFVFQATILASGLGLVLLSGQGLDVLVTRWTLGLKFFLLLLVIALLANIHFGLQPRIDALFAQLSGPVPPEVAARIGALRLRRKRTASVCMFAVLTAVILGVQAWTPFPLWLTASLVAAIALFTWRTYTTVTPYGWV
jgi:hypothetical protein